MEFYENLGIKKKPQKNNHPFVMILYFSSLFKFLYIYLCIGSSGVQTQGLAHSRQVLLLSYVPGPVLFLHAGHLKTRQLKSVSNH
jgi:hypothetical protein